MQSVVESNETRGTNNRCISINTTMTLNLRNTEQLIMDNKTAHDYQIKVPHSVSQWCQYQQFIMAAVYSRCRHYIFACGFFLLFFLT